MSVNAERSELRVTLMFERLDGDSEVLECARFGARFDIDQNALVDKIALNLANTAQLHLPKFIAPKEAIA